ncbi:transmembrane protein EpsG [Paenibacillus endophyticus]|uniref:Transmembrane protein EpsG n=1 Tax=Paenibacillus endophyticus TaxID=1294268 RepID=A0A7W5G7I8_9BACL|nr:EpsG family protein [Paenibacillus endophyticus]MBB3150039.1 transmembrane protein EpsG [Paenibacillus endophyticus]
MTILWLNLIVVFSFALISRYFAVKAAVGPTFLQPNKIMAAAAALTLILVSGLRNNIGDTFFYMHAYTVDRFDWQSVIQKKDMGFGILQLLLKQISNDPQILLMTTAFVTNMLIAIVMYKYSRFYELSIYVYITSGAFIVSMNGLRQFLAAAIVFAATKALFDGKMKTYMAVVLFAAVFHQSALVMLPLYFIVRRKAWTGTTFFLLSIAIMVVVGFNQFSDLLFQAIQGTQYAHYQNFQEGGASIIRVFIYAVPLLICFLGREKLRSLFPKVDILVNLSIIGIVLMIISTQNWIFARMTIYFNLYQLILIGWIVKIFREKDQKLVYFAILIFYLLFFYFESVVALDIRYTSDYLKWPS